MSEADEMKDRRIRQYLNTNDANPVDVFKWALGKLNDRLRIVTIEESLGIDNDRVILVTSKVNYRLILDPPKKNDK